MQIATDRAGSAGQDVVVGVRGPFAARHLCRLPGRPGRARRGGLGRARLPPGAVAAPRPRRGPPRARRTATSRCGPGWSCEDERDLSRPPSAASAACSTSMPTRPPSTPPWPPTRRCARWSWPRPGCGWPAASTPFETAVRAVIGQQISVAGARTVAGRVVAAVGEPLAVPGGAADPRVPVAGPAGRHRSGAAADAGQPTPHDRRAVERGSADGRIDLAAASRRRRGGAASTCRASARGRPATSACGRSATRTCSSPPTSGSRSVCTALGVDADPRRAVAPVALVRPPPRVDGGRLPVPGRSDVIAGRIVDSPIGPLTLLAGRTGLREVRFSNAPPVELPPDRRRDARHRARRHRSPAGGVLRGPPARLRPRPGPGRHRLPAGGVGGARPASRTGRR